MSLFHVHSAMTFYVTIGDTDYTVSLSPEDGQPVVIKHDHKGKRDIIPRPELGSLLSELITRHLREQASAWDRMGALYRTPAVEI